MDAALNCAQEEAISTLEEQKRNKIFDLEADKVEVPYFTIYTPLKEAIEDGDIELTRQLLKLTMEAAGGSNDLDNFIKQAFGNIEMLDLLLEYAQDLVPDYRLGTVFDAALKANNQAMIEYFLNNDDDLDDPAYCGRRFLEAVREEQYEVAKTLYNRTRPTDKKMSRAVKEAYKNNHFDFTKWLIDHGANPSNKSYRTTDVRRAIRKGADPAIVRLLLEADDNNKSVKKARTIKSAIGSDNPEYLKLLIEYGAKVDEIADVDDYNENDYGSHPLQVLLSQGQSPDLNLIEKLVQEGMELPLEKPALKRDVIKTADPDTIDYFVDKGVNIRADEFYEAVHTTTDNINHLLNNHYTPRGSVMEKGLNDIIRDSSFGTNFEPYKRIKTLVEQGANLNWTDTPPLSVAAKTANAKLIQWLLYLGADPTVSNHQPIKTFVESNRIRNAKKKLACIFARKPKVVNKHGKQYVEWFKNAGEDDYINVVHHYMDDAQSSLLRI